LARSIPPQVSSLIFVTKKNKQKLLISNLGSFVTNLFALPCRWTALKRPNFSLGHQNRIERSKVKNKNSTGGKKRRGRRKRAKKQWKSSKTVADAECVGEQVAQATMELLKGQGVDGRRINYCEAPYYMSQVLTLDGVKKDQMQRLPGTTSLSSSLSHGLPPPSPPYCHMD
jgi:hypothetical protein